MTAGTIDGCATRGKREPTGLRPVAALLALAVGLASIQKADAQAPAPSTLPTGGQVSAGQVSIAQSGSQLSINQGSSRTIINWQSFSIGSQAEVDFHQPSSSSVALNRVVTGIPSQIFGRLTANGQVFLVNPGGILFGPGAQVNIGGLVASTMALSDSDFLAGNYVFNRDGATAAVENQGTITATSGGMVVLLAPTVVNEGTITAPGGAVVAAAGEQIALTIDDGVSVQVDPALVQTLIDNHGMIAAPGGRVILTAQAVDTILGGAINNSGVIDAGSIHDNGGTVTLDAGGSLADSGVIDASGAEVGGTVTLSGRSINLTEAQIAATGGAAGGSIAVGGSSTGAVSVDAASELDASARTTGNGGAIYVYGQTDSFAGTALARGGALGGNGGQVETSGESLDVAGARIDTSAPNGHAGSWLLDPFDLTVGTAAATTIATDLGTTNVTLKTTATSTSGPGTVSAGDGDITVAVAISAPLATNSLTL
ncbi:MAG TPA: filamentous hemagglutinin N-terminal domain-containing protein, partial [Stellaceae bacterium]|nr:filamentous hemagglutinin N-terminal domain-containing protein [Stellaceae bacterium]